MASDLNDKIRTFYDESTPLWLDHSGEHMHHGFYGLDGRAQKPRIEAQTDMIRELLEWADITVAENILDLGCGVGGSARHLARQFDAQVLGLTLSPVQAEAAARYNRQSGLADKVSVQVKDMMQLQPAENLFDLIWSMESAEHIADKQGLLNLCRSLLTPGGCLLMATWCRRDTTTKSLTSSEEKLLHQIGRFYHLPPMISMSQYENLAQDAGFKKVKTADWSAAVAPFWGEVIRSALTWRGLTGLLHSGTGTIKGAWAMRYMRQGYQTGLIRFGVLQAWL